MSYILYDMYITINRQTKDKGFFLGPVPLRNIGNRFRDIEIINEKIKDIFVYLPKENSNISEFHILPSWTKGEYLRAGAPEDSLGTRIWGRIKLQDGTTGPWIFLCDYGNTYVHNTLSTFACRFTLRFCEDIEYRTALLNSIANQASNNVVDSQNVADEVAKEVQKLDFSQSNTQILWTNGFKITIEKLKSNTK